jgi:hypothetical protein
MARVVRLVVFAVVAVTVLAFGATIIARPGGLASVVPGHCTMGLAGAAVSVTYDGLGADAQCDRWNATTTDGGSWYRYQGNAQPGGAVICQEPAHGTTATVRDQGVMNIYGTQVCKYLADQP